MDSYQTPIPGSHRTLIIGASGGLGRCIHRAAVKREFFCEGTYRSRVTPEATLELDLERYESIDALVAQLTARGELFDSIVVNSGISELGPQLAISRDDYERVFRVNFLGPRYLIKEMLPLLTPSARIVLVGSMVSWGAIPLSGPYAVSKRALREFWQLLRQELVLSIETAELKLVLVEPGAYKTRIWEAGRETLDVNLGRGTKLPGFVKWLASQGSDPEDFGEAIVDIIENKDPSSYYRMGAFSTLSRMAEWLPVGVRITAIRWLRQWGFELVS